MRAVPRSRSGPGTHSGPGLRTASTGIAGSAVSASPEAVPAATTDTRRPIHEVRRRPPARTVSRRARSAGGVARDAGPAPRTTSPHLSVTGAAWRRRRGSPAPPHLHARPGDLERHVRSGHPGGTADDLTPRRSDLPGHAGGHPRRLRGRHCGDSERGDGREWSSGEGTDPRGDDGPPPGQPGRRPPVRWEDGTCTSRQDGAGLDRLEVGHASSLWHCHAVVPMMDPAAEHVHRQRDGGQPRGPGTVTATIEPATPPSGGPSATRRHR